MKVLHINSYYLVSSFYKNLFDKQSESGLDIDVYMPIKKGSRFNHFIGDYTHCIPCYNSFDRIFFFLKQFKIRQAFINEFGSKRYDIIHAHSLFTNGYLAYKQKKFNGTPYIVVIRNTDVNIFLNRIPILRPLGNSILKHASHIIFLSPAYREKVIYKYIPIKLQDEILKKTTIIPNGVGEFWIKNIGKPRTIQNKNEISLLFVGRINKNKNIMAIVDACNKCVKNGFAIKLTIVGNIGDSGYFSKIVKYPFVSYLPFASTVELLKIYRGHDIFVMPSKKESFGLVYAEAMSQGLPVVYTKGQGFDQQFVDGEVGFSVDANNTEEIARKILCIIDNYSAISASCVEKVKKFQWDNIEEEYRSIYEKCMF